MDKNKYYMNIALLSAKRSKCLSRQVGAVLVKDDSIISVGFNGPSRGMTHCGDIGGCIRRAMHDYESGKYLDKCPAAHAEQNAVAFAAYHGVSTKDAVCYVTEFPCKDCMNSLINAGVKKIYFYKDYNSELSKKIASTVNIDIEHIDTIGEIKSY